LLQRFSSGWLVLPDQNRAAKTRNSPNIERVHTALRM
jgi:hypothetical protein